VKTIFAEELDYLTRRRWDFAQHKPDFLLALNSDLFSLRHLDEIHRMMDAEKATQAQAEKDKAKNLTGDHRRY
jgi:hypothetical protein